MQNTNINPADFANAMADLRSSQDRRQAALDLPRPTADDLEIPDCLRRNGPRLTHEQARQLVDTRTRTWAPVRHHADRPRPTADIGQFDRPDLPIVVAVRHSDGSRSVLARYDNFESLRQEHDVVAHPIYRVACTDSETFVLTIAKPWSKHYKPPITPEAAAAKAALPTGRSKTLVIAALLQRPDGCTTKEVLEATGWPSVSMPAQAKAAGLVLTKERRDGAMRYFGRHQ